MKITTKIDSTNLNQGLRLLQQGYTRRTPAIAVNTAGYMVARRTLWAMPSTPMAKIDTELGVTVTPIVPTHGVRKGSTNITMNSNSFDKEKNLAMMIVVSRMHQPGISRASGKPNFNLLTGNYWAIGMPATSDSAAFWNWVEDAAERMVRARHSSTSFLKSCWIPAIKALEPYAAKSAGGGTAPLPPPSMKYIADSGYAKPAQIGQTQAMCEIGNSAGVGGKNSVLNQKHNDALWRVAVPVLQRAINDEAQSIMQHVADIEWKRDQAKLARSGLLLT